jgi:hypothetical protein
MLMNIFVSMPGSSISVVDVAADLHRKQDTDRSGNIAFNEFAGLYKYIEDWQGFVILSIHVLYMTSHKKCISSLGRRSQRHH